MADEIKIPTPLGPVELAIFDPTDVRVIFRRITVHRSPISGFFQLSKEADGSWKAGCPSAAHYSRGLGGHVPWSSREKIREETAPAIIAWLEDPRNRPFLLQQAIAYMESQTEFKRSTMECTKQRYDEAVEAYQMHSGQLAAVRRSLAESQKAQEETIEDLHL
jgi:uncharacterized protein YeeX (DUF496 family)